MFTQERLDVVIAHMPFAFLFRPSLDASLSKAELQANGISCKILYFTLPFAERSGTTFYFRVANETPDRMTLAGDWIFSHDLFGNKPQDEARYVQEVLRPKGYSDGAVRELLAMREQIGDYLQECVNEIQQSGCSIVVFPVTPQQMLPSLSLANRIRKQLPGLKIIIGGSQIEGETADELLREFPFLDAVIAAELDMVLPVFVERILKSVDAECLQGVFMREVECNPDSHKSGVPVLNMNALPFPNYDDFFEQLNESHLDYHERPRIPFETSRGCWWGEKRHCTFCGLIGTNMRFRSKSADRAFEELQYLVQCYPGHEIWARDFILDMQYFNNFIPKLIESGIKVQMFYEVKSNLNKNQLRLLRDAGIKLIQPGIESFSNRVLEIMRKGVTGLQNIQLLKWCKELGIKPFWNLIWGFPGEPPEEYSLMSELVRKLTHLQSPQYAGPIRLDRFSPNFKDPGSSGFVNIQPDPAFTFVYPLRMESVQNLAYSFSFQYSKPTQVSSYTDALSSQVQVWESEHETSDLFMVDKNTHLLIWDLRPGFNQPLTVLTGLQKELYLLCDRIQSERSLRMRLSDDVRVEDLLGPLLDRGLMIRDGESYLSLAISLGPYSPSQAVIKRFHNLVEKSGQTFSTLLMKVS